MPRRPLLLILCVLFVTSWQGIALGDEHKCHPIHRGCCFSCPKPRCLEAPKPCPPTRYQWVVCHPNCPPRVRPCRDWTECCDTDEEGYRQDPLCCDDTVKAVIVPPKTDICAPNCEKCKPPCRWVRHRCCCCDLYKHKCKVCRPKFYLTYTCCGDDQHGEVDEMDIWRFYPGQGPNTDPN